MVITADAHDAKALTYGFEEAAAKLKELGYTKVQVLVRTASSLRTVKYFLKFPGRSVTAAAVFAFL